MKHLVTSIRIKQLQINDEQDPIRKQKLEMELEILQKQQNIEALEKRIKDLMNKNRN
jgi:hypothetical protein